MFKKITLLIMSGFINCAMAGTMGPVCQPGVVTIDCPGSGWGVGVYGMYVRMDMDADFDYVGTSNTSNPLILNNFKADSNWGLILEGAYYFGSGNDVTLSWQHLAEKNTSNTFNDSTWTPSYIKTKWDGINVEFGQVVKMSQAVAIRFHGGAQYATVKNSFGHDEPANGNRVFGVSQFSGFGPRIGLDSLYDWQNGFAMYAKAATALLAAKSKFEIANTIPISSASGSIVEMVAEVDTKLGGKYSHALDSGQLIIDGGWMFVNYFNANHTIVANFALETDIAFNGPFVGIHWLGNA